MKKFIAIFFLFAYSITTVGAAAHFHYCNDKLLSVSFSFDSKKNNGCGNSHSHEEKDNCKDKHGNIEEGNDQNVALANKFYNAAFESTATLISFSSYNTPGPLKISISYPSVNAPPIVPKLRLHLLNRVFLI